MVGTQRQNHKRDGRIVLGSKRIVEKCGLLSLSLVLFVIGAFGISAAAGLPLRYTWLRPLQIIGKVSVEPGISMRILLVAVLGLIASGKHFELIKTLKTKATTVRLLQITGILIGVILLSFMTNYSMLDGVSFSLFAFVCFVAIPLPRTANVWKIIGESAYLVMVFTLVSYGFTLAKGAVFVFGDPADYTIIALESRLFGRPVHEMVAEWSAQYPNLLRILDQVYYRMFDHMMLTFVFLVVFQSRILRHQFVSSLVICYMFGGFAYHILPVLGPVFYEPQHYVHLKNLPLLTNDFHSFLAHNTDAAIARELNVITSYEFISAMPSLHVAHESVMLYYVRNSKPLFFLSILFLCATVVSTLALGWHYFLDLFGGVALAYVSIRLVHRYRTMLFPLALR